MVLQKVVLFCNVERPPVGRSRLYHRCRRIYPLLLTHALNHCAVLVAPHHAAAIATDGVDVEGVLGERNRDDAVAMRRERHWFVPLDRMQRVHSACRIL